jgi:hypothetical protein
MQDARAKEVRLSLARCGIDIHDGVDVCLSKAPKQEDAYERLFAFFEQCKLFHTSNWRRGLQDNLFWESLSSTVKHN